MRAFGCHAEILLEKRYRTKDLTSPNSESAIFIGYCRQSAGYIFYIPDKHLVVSRRDADFNQSYYPAKVGDTMLIPQNKTKTDFSDDLALPDGTASMALPEARQTRSTSSIKNVSFSDENYIKTIENDDKNDDYDDKNSVESGSRQRVSPRPLPGRFGKPVASANTAPSANSHNDLDTKTPSFGAKNPKTTSPDVENNLKLLLDPDSHKHSS